MAEASAPAPPSPLAEHLRSRIDSACFHAMHPISKEGVVELVKWAVEVALKDKRQGRELLTLWAAAAPTL
jgi:hypothetical protein